MAKRNICRLIKQGINVDLILKGRRFKTLNLKLLFFLVGCIIIYTSEGALIWLSSLPKGDDRRAVAYLVGTRGEGVARSDSPAGGRAQ